MAFQAKQQHTAKARSLYKEALKLDPSHMQSLLGLAVLEARSGRPRVALKMYMRGLQIEPDNVQLLHASAQLLKQQGQQEVDSCPNSLAQMLHPTDSHALVRWAVSTLYKVSKTGGAVRVVFIRLLGRKPLVAPVICCEIQKSVKLLEFRALLL